MESTLKKTSIVFLFFQIILMITDKINSVQIATNCPSNQFYDPNLYDCLSCPTNMVPRKDGTIII